MDRQDARQPKLTVDDVSIAYGTGATQAVVVSHASASLVAGEFVSIVGPSGCGKSTVLMAVDGLVPVVGGRILIDGDPIGGPGRDRGVVFQDASLLPWRTVAENVCYGLDLLGHLSRSERAAETERLLEVVGLRGWGKHYPHQISGGMQQRVNLARALAVHPEVLLLDEPFAALDAQTRELMQDELLRVWTAERTTALFVTHQIEEAIYLSDRILVMNAGPGRIVREIVIPFSRPRDGEIKRTRIFHDLVDEIWDLIRADARRSLGAYEPDDPQADGSGSPR